MGKPRRPATGLGYDLKTAVWLPRPRETVFAFCSDVRTLVRIAPPFLRLKLETPGLTTLSQGARMECSLRLGGMPVRWRAEVTEFLPPSRFLIVQSAGPYAEWSHTHTFETHDNGTLMHDHVVYRLRGPAWLNRWLHEKFVKTDLRAIFEHRHDAMLAALGGVGKVRPVIITDEGDPS